MGSSCYRHLQCVADDVKMKINISRFLAISLTLVNTSTYADDSAWDICTTEGYYVAGTNSLFLAGLAHSFATKMKISCLDDYRDAYFLGKETANIVFSGGDPRSFTAMQRKAFKKADDFQEKVNTFIIDGVKAKFN